MIMTLNFKLIVVVDGLDSNLKNFSKKKKNYIRAEPLEMCRMYLYFSRKKNGKIVM